MLLLPGQAELFSLVLSPPRGCAGVGGGGAGPGHPWVLVGDALFQSGCPERSKQGGATSGPGQGKELLPCALSLILPFPSQLVP